MLLVSLSNCFDTLWCCCKEETLEGVRVTKRDLFIPHRVVIHHDEQHQKEMMDAQKAVVEVLAHLTRRERPNDEQTCDHRPARKSRRCQKHQTKDVLRDETTRIWLIALTCSATPQGSLASHHARLAPNLFRRTSDRNASRNLSHWRNGKLSEWLKFECKQE